MVGDDKRYVWLEVSKQLKQMVADDPDKPYVTVRLCTECGRRESHYVHDERYGFQHGTEFHKYVH